MYKLLIVDDNVRERNGVARLKLWEELGFDEIHTAGNGSEGVAKAAETNPMLVISDVSMPIMDGLMMAKEILKLNPNTKFIFMSCFDDSNYIRKAIDLNAFAYMLKPINLAKLRESVVKILNIDEFEQKQKSTIETLKNEINRNLSLLREQLMRDWFFDNVNETDYGQFEQMQLNIKRFCAVAVIQINNIEEMPESVNCGGKYVAVNMIAKFLQEKDVRNCCFVQSRHEIGTLLYSDNAVNGVDALNMAIDYFEKIKSEINDTLKIEMSVYIGGITDSYGEVPKLYERADNFMRNGICAKRNSIVVVDEGQIMDEPPVYDMLKLKNEIYVMLESGVGIDEFVETYLTKETLHSEFAVKKFAFTVITTLQLVLFEMDGSSKMIFDDEVFVWKKLEKYSAVEEIKNLLTNILKFSADGLQASKTDRYMKMVNDIKKIIEQQYTNLKNVEQIVAQIHFSAVHANAVFKKYTGCTIFDYLTQYKIEQAKKMLASGNSRVYEVADFLGYKNKNYFTSLFKEYTGLTPSQYRDKINYEN